jgi:hypothetical protein
MIHNIEKTLLLYVRLIDFSLAENCRILYWKASFKLTFYSQLWC